MKNSIVYLVVIVLLVFSSFAPKETNKKVLSLKEFEKEVFVLVNQYREKQGLKALKSNDYISNIAREHSKRMATGKVRFGHKGFDKRFNELSKKLGILSMAENVIYNYDTPASAVKGWIESTGHRQNIEGNYTITGIGAYKNKKGSIYITQIFAKK